MKVEVCYALSTGATRIALELPDGSRVDDALAASGIFERLSLDRTQLTFAVFGKRATPETVLKDGDRVELLRPLVVDPMEARRRRAEVKDRQR